MIQESTIERVLDRLEAAREDFRQEIADFAEAQPYLMDYLTNEDTGAFTEDERELLLFGSIVIYHAVTDERFEPETIPGAAIAEAEEKNYGLISEARGTFRERITPLFEASEEEELLAFVEDMLLGEDGGDSPVELREGNSVTKEGREPLFLTLKTVVDVLR